MLICVGETIAKEEHDGDSVHVSLQIITDNTLDHYVQTKEYQIQQKSEYSVDEFKPVALQ